jgi:predicted ATPase
VKVSNYRVIGKSAQADLHPLTIVVGPNGCGKSTLLDVIRSTLVVANGRAVELPESSEVMIQSLEASGAGAQIRKPSGARHALAEVFDSKNTFAPDLSFSAWPKVTLHLRFEMSKLRMPSHPNVNATTFEPDGSNLTRIIADYRLSNQTALDGIRSQLAKVVPVIRDVKVRLTNVFELLFDTQARTDIEASYMSDGTLFALGLITALHFVEGKRALLLIDDIDQGLHPLAQRELIGMLRLIQNGNPGLQIIATTHSPYLVACVNPDEVLCMHLGEDGFSRMAPLTAHPEFDRWKAEMNPGEFWSLFGDEWVLQAAEA